MTWWHYLLLVNFYLVLFFGFYTLFLRRETFFQLNRAYLVAASLLSFFIPLIQANWVQDLFITQQVQQTIYNGPRGMIYNFTVRPTADNSITLGQIINVIYITVTVFLVIRLAWQLLVLKKAIEKPAPSAAYSFFKKISLGENNSQSNLIAQHEQVHAGQWHSADVMIIEIVMIINWFNPVVYLYRFAIKYIHEFIADRQVIQAGANKADYALLLLSQTFEVDNHTLVTPFYNHSLLKQRITMLQKNKSQRIALAKYGLSAPLFILMLIFSSATVNNSKAAKLINKKTEKVFAMPATAVIKQAVPFVKQPANSPVVKQATVITAVKHESAATTIAADTDKIFFKVEKQPMFPGGFPAFGSFLANNVHYPAEDKANKVSGMSIVTFVIEQDGTLTNIKVVRSPTEAMGKEAKRVLLLSPKWTPGYQDGKAVRVSYTVPIRFTLPADGPNNPGNGKPPIVNETAGGEKIYSIVEKQPQFPGGLEALGKFLGGNVRYPKEDRENGVSGKVICTFVVETDGTLSDVRAVRGPSETMKKEAVRVMLTSPKWTPGTQNGAPVRVSYTLPIQFTLGEPEDNEVYQKVDKQPAFKDGWMEGFTKFLSSNIRYPAADRKNGVEGKVIVQFVVETDGSLTNFKVIRTPSEAMGAEAVRVLSLSPKWNPGILNLKAVRTMYTVPINFALDKTTKP
ncbi:TonB family protein [Mucilaginibacter sp. UR6-11]|uniref:TonB family protein n=1 Tax=Mucilaginibacter sp. UR6-11 TaxID=1435644 RepID=UPI001E39DDBA|nr:M56 family metallopeptidase [Mucilaginibacter sp. UR6-11]MCC8426890.1 M56 family metallopeptidase [Mucilaginibacter sp. UR6-11]